LSESTSYQIFDGAGVAVIGGVGQTQCRGAQFLAGCFVHVGRWRPFNDFLIAALNRAVALEEMHHVAMLVAENLHLNVAGAAISFSR
jgi:hypothetical protein